MIYTVECSFTDPTSESDWNDFYSLEKLPALISVSGFHTSQRFKAITDGCPVYLALHTIDGLPTLEGEEYRRKGGGNFAKWQQYITDWHRNLYGDIGVAPAVHTDECLVLSANGGEALADLGLVPLAMHAVALEKSPAHRWLSKVAKQNAPRADRLPSGVFVYAPMTEQLRKSAGPQAKERG